MRLRSGSDYSPSSSPPLTRLAGMVAFSLDRVSQTLDAWSTRATPGENRREAAMRIFNCASRLHFSGTQSPTLQLAGLGLTNLPEVIGALVGTQQLFLQDNQLTELPDSIGQLRSLKFLDVGRNLLSRLPDTLAPLSALDRLLIHDNQLTELPDALGALPQLQHLEASNNRLSALPDTLTHSPSLQSLLVSNNRLHTLPAGLAQMTGLEKLMLSGNRFTAIPDVIRPLYRCEVWLTDNPLTPAAIARFRAEPYSALLMVSETEPRTDRPAVSLAAGINHWRAHLPDMPDAAWHHAEQDHAAEFGSWLHRLLETPEFTHEHTRDALIQRVGSLLDEMSADEGLRNTLFHVADTASTSCIDNVALGLNNMELALHNHHAQAGRLSEQELFELGVGMFRMAQLTRLAEHHIARQRAADEGVTDPVEVHLAFQVQLRQRLCLPVRTQHMQFSNLANLEHADLEQAAHDIETRCAEPAAPFIRRYDDTLHDLSSATPPMLKRGQRQHQLARYLACDYTPWGAHVGRHYPQQSAALKERLHAYLTWLSQQLAAGHIQENELIDASNAAAFYANHGTAYRHALSWLQGAAGGTD